MSDPQGDTKGGYTWAVLTTIGLLSRVVLDGAVLVFVFLATRVVPDWERRAEGGDVVGAISLLGGQAFSQCGGLR